MGTALVTGAYGFLGRHVAKFLAEQGYLVTGIGHGVWPDSKSVKWGISRFLNSDVSYEHLLACDCRPDLLVHCAGSGSVGTSFVQPHQELLRNVVTASAIFEYVREVVPRCKVVFPSSAAVYGIASCIPIAENSLLQPISPYGYNKLYCEQLAAYYSKYFGISTAIVRLFSIYGVGLQRQLFWDACQKLVHGDSTFHGTGEETRDWLHVSDAVRLMYLAAKNASPNCMLINAGSGVGTRVKDALTLIARKFGVHSLRFLGVQRRGDPTDYQADIRLARALGWAPQIGLEKGLSEFVDAFQGTSL